MENQNTKKHVDTREFAVAWQEASSVREVAERFGISPEQASAKASALRSKRNIPLKTFERSSATDWDSLRELIQGMKV